MEVSQTRAPRVAVVTEAGRDDGSSDLSRAGLRSDADPAANPDLPPLSRQLNASQ